jgi:hypothetical protein
MFYKPKLLLFQFKEFDTQQEEESIPIESDAKHAEQMVHSRETEVKNRSFFQQEPSTLISYFSQTPHLMRCATCFIAGQKDWKKRSTGNPLKSKTQGQPLKLNAFIIIQPTAAV